MYSKMVPHHIEGMMIGFVMSMIKLNTDVFGRLITVALNQKFMVMGEPLGPNANHAAPPAHGEAPYANLYKMYLI